jgi:hypothetical protein
MTRLQVTGLLLALAIATATARAEDAGVLAGSLLLYEEQEAGTDAYPVRILVVPGYLRMDEGNDEDDYLLFDRSSGTIASVSHEQRMILSIEELTGSGQGPALPDVELGMERVAAPDMPPVAGRTPELYRFTAHRDTCLEVVVVPGLMQAAVEALAEYGRVLAARQLATLENTPREMWTPCFLARNVLAPARHLSRGLPIEERDGHGYQRVLLDFRSDVELAAGLFRLPEGYISRSLGR